MAHSKNAGFQGAQICTSFPAPTLSSYTTMGKSHDFPEMIFFPVKKLMMPISVDCVD